MAISTTLKHIERCMLYTYVDFFRNHHRNIDVPAKNELFVGPHTYKRFMDCLRYTYTLKAKRRTQTVCRLK